MFMQKERTHQRSLASKETEPVEYLPRKFFCQLIYRELEKVNGLTQEQYEVDIKNILFWDSYIHCYVNITKLYFLKKVMAWMRGLRKLLL